jgi:hypothetical protein
MRIPDNPIMNTNITNGHYDKKYDGPQNGHNCFQVTDKQSI